MKLGSGKQRLYAAGPAIIIVSVTIIAWEMIVRAFNIKPLFLPPLRNTLLPILLVVQSVPKQAFAPLVLVWFGYGDVPKIIIALLVGFFPIVVDTTAGLNAVEPELIDLARVVQASKMKILWKIRLPNSLPYFFNGLKIASALSVVGALVAEFLTGTYGLGYMLLNAQFHMNTALTITIIFVLGLIGIGLFGAASLAERLAMPWKRRMGGGGG
jgi:NitT/TauT family transport system permease protein